MDRGGTEKLTARDRQIAALVASGQTYTEAATRLGVSERTVRRTMARDEVRKLVESIRDERVAAVVGTLGELSCTAAATLETLMKSGTATVKLGAARAVFDYLIRGREHAELARRVSELEKSGNESRGPDSEVGEGTSGPTDGPAGGCDIGSVEGGPGGSVDPGRSEAGPVASEVDSGEIPADVGSLFSSVGEESDGVG